MSGATGFLLLVPNIVKAQEAIRQNDPEALKAALSPIIACLKKIVHKSLFNINPNSYSEDYIDHIVWAKTVAPFAVPFERMFWGPVAPRLQSLTSLTRF